MDQALCLQTEPFQGPGFESPIERMTRRKNSLLFLSQLFLFILFIYLFIAESGHTVIHMMIDLQQVQTACVLYSAVAPVFIYLFIYLFIYSSFYFIFFNYLFTYHSCIVNCLFVIELH